MEFNEEQAKKLQEAQDKILADALQEAKDRNRLETANLLEDVLKGEDNHFMSDKAKKIVDDNITFKDVSKPIDNKREVDNIIKKEPIVNNNYDWEEDDSDLDDYFEQIEDLDEFNGSYDVVPIPSLGLIYGDKNIGDKIPVSYVTASDEDLITSPNLYMDDKIIDLLLSKKILNRKIRPEELCVGDRDAIVVWLRVNAYGEMFPVSVTDPVTGIEFETEVDLSTLKFNTFTLKPNKNGLFDYQTKFNKHIKDNIEFNFISYKDHLSYMKMIEKSTPIIKKTSLNSAIEIVDNIIISDNKIKSDDKMDFVNLLKKVKEYTNNIKTHGNVYSQGVTYLLNKLIKSINGNTDREFIKDYIKNMPARESMAFRKYVTKNTPSIDYRVKIERPENLGGGSFETFLELDSTIFINTSE